MGIHGLMKLLSDECPLAIKEYDLNNYTGRKIAIDASMAMYQFLIAVRSNDGRGSTMLTNDAGEVTSHIQGMFNRTIKLLSSGVKPVYVFEWEPPDFKSGELEKRLERRNQAQAELGAAIESGNQEDIDKFSRRLVKVGKHHNEDCKQLLRLMGVPVICAPCEAEAQCAELAKSGKVYGTATEDMDALTFRTPKLIRKLTFNAANKQPIIEIDLELALVGLQLTYEQFVDLCILCGCDYCSTIKGIGPKTALKLIRQYKTLEGVVKALKADKKQHQLPKEWVAHRVKKQKEATDAPPVVSNDASSTEEPATDDAKPETILDSSVSADVSTAVAGTTEGSGSSAVDPTAPVAVNTNGSFGGDDEDDGLIIPNEDEDEKIDESEEIEINMDIDIEQTAEGDDDNRNGTGDGNDGEEADEEGVEYEDIEPHYKRVRGLFFNAEVTPGNEVELKWESPKEEELRVFLVEKMGFNEERVKAGIKKLVEAQQKKAQQRLDSFFKPVPQSDSAMAAAAAAAKRKAADAKSGSSKGGSKAARGGRGGAFKR